MSQEESLQILIEQLQILSVFLARPSVQRQLAALAMILLFSWALPVVMRTWGRRFLLKKDGAIGAMLLWRQRLGALYLLYAPLLALILVQMTEWIFARLGYPYGMLSDALPLLLFWLFYRTGLAWLYHRYDKAIEPYHYWVMLPLLLWLFGAIIAENFINLRLIAAIPLFPVFGVSLTVGNLFAAALALYWSIIASWVAEMIMRCTLGDRAIVDPGVIESMVTITRYVVISFGALLALYILGFNLSSLALIGGGLSIGVGFGLQKIISNFISGLVLLFEQSMLPGDIIDLNGRIGTVEKVNIRSTTVRTINNVELIVPNETFMITEVTTFTKSDKQIRVMIPIGVSYDSDPHEVKQVVQNVAGQHPLVLTDPPPELFFRGYGDSSLNFDLAVWIDQPVKLKRISSDLYYMIWDALAEHQIEIPFPQRDLNLRHGWEEALAR